MVYDKVFISFSWQTIVHVIEGIVNCEFYLCSFQVNGSDALDSKTMKLRVNTTGHGLHAFFNGELVGNYHLSHLYDRFST